MLCSEPIQRKPQRGAAEGRPPLWRRPKAASFVLALNKAHVLALNTAHVLRLNKADVLALNKAHIMRLNTKICPVFKFSYFQLLPELLRTLPKLLREPPWPNQVRKGICQKWVQKLVFDTGGVAKSQKNIARERRWRYRLTFFRLFQGPPTPNHRF